VGCNANKRRSKESIIKLLLVTSVGEGDCRSCHKLPSDDVNQNNASCLSAQNWIRDYLFYLQSDAGTCPATCVFSLRFDQIAFIHCYVTSKDVQVRGATQRVMLKFMAGRTSL
jgi:hypothetical protein